jgi:hypothetical protein
MNCIFFFFSLHVLLSLYTFIYILQPLIFISGYMEARIYKKKELQSIRGDETVNVNKPSPVSPQLTARSGQRAQLVQGTHYIRTHVNLYSDFGHPCNGTSIT